mmetsp:Transcript_18630/g.40024  ORF Transcript_18630/g.40024 Transcript_18630/m.40024 type:complete len:205 (-) Transcript_18630:1233-1847(-)
MLAFSTSSLSRCCTVSANLTARASTSVLILLMPSCLVLSRSSTSFSTAAMRLAANRAWSCAAVSCSCISPMLCLAVANSLAVWSLLLIATFASCFAASSAPWACLSSARSSSRACSLAFSCCLRPTCSSLKACSLAASWLARLLLCIASSSCIPCSVLSFCCSLLIRSSRSPSVVRSLEESWMASSWIWWVSSPRISSRALSLS